MKQETITVAELADILSGKKKLPPPEQGIKPYVAKFDVNEYFRSIRPGESPSPEIDHAKPGHPESGHPESELQQRCVAWFRSEYPDIAPLLVAVPNAARRKVYTAAIMKREGLTAGVADLILLVSRGGFGTLCIEMKIKRSSSRQSDRQKEWEQVATAHGNKYVVCRTDDEFKSAITEYLNND